MTRANRSMRALGDAEQRAMRTLDELVARAATNNASLDAPEVGGFTADLKPSRADVEGFVEDLMEEFDFPDRVRDQLGKLIIQTCQLYHRTRAPLCDREALKLEKKLAAIASWRNDDTIVRLVHAWAGRDDLMHNGGEWDVAGHNCMRASLELLSRNADLLQRTLRKQREQRKADRKSNHKPEARLYAVLYHLRSFWEIKLRRQANKTHTRLKGSFGHFVEHVVNFIDRDAVRKIPSVTRQMHDRAAK